MKKLSFLILTAYCFLLSSSPVQAIITNPVLNNPETPSRNPTVYFNNVLGAVFTIFFIVGVIYFIWHIVFAGYHLISSEGDPKRWESSKYEIAYAAVGLFTVFSIFAILKLVGTVFGITGLESLTAIPWPSI